MQLHPPSPWNTGWSDGPFPDAPAKKPMLVSQIALAQIAQKSWRDAKQPERLPLARITQWRRYLNRMPNLKITSSATLRSCLFCGFTMRPSASHPETLRTSNGRSLFHGY